MKWRMLIILHKTFEFNLPPHGQRMLQDLSVIHCVNCWYLNQSQLVAASNSYWKPLERRCLEIEITGQFWEANSPLTWWDKATYKVPSYEVPSVKMNMESPPIFIAQKLAKFHIYFFRTLIVVPYMLDLNRVFRHGPGFNHSLLFPIPSFFINFQKFHDCKILNVSKLWNLWISMKNGSKWLQRVLCLAQWFLT